MCHASSAHDATDEWEEMGREGNRRERKGRMRMDGKNGRKRAGRDEGKK